jgi:hypothetical protein
LIPDRGIVGPRSNAPAIREREKSAEFQPLVVSSTLPKTGAHQSIPHGNQHPTFEWGIARGRIGDAASH